MKKLAKQVLYLKKSSIQKIIENRLKEFFSFSSKDSGEWFSELCFCILTANSKAKTAIKIQEFIGADGFLEYPEEKISRIIREHKHRFHNTKAKYIISARKFKNIKEILSNKKNPREFIVKNIKGLGKKEASHFLRNTGNLNYSIIDRHILNLLHENKILKFHPREFKQKDYEKVEDILKEISAKTKTSLGELDLYLWYMKTGEVLK